MTNILSKISYSVEGLISYMILRGANRLSFTEFRDRVAMFDHTVRGALSPPHTERAPGFATQDHAQARDLNAAQGNTQVTEATSANLLSKECKGCSEAGRPNRPASRIQAIVTSQDSADRRLRLMHFTVT